MHRFLSLVCVTTTVCGIGLAATAVRADDSPRTWTLKPATATAPDDRAYLVHDATPGASITDHVAVTNFSESPLELDLYASDAFTTEGGGFDLLARDEPPVDVGSWIALDQPSVRLAAGETAVVGLTLTVPLNATPGDHSGGVVAALSTESTDAEGNLINVEHRVGPRVYLRVDGPLDPRLELDDVDASYRGTANPIGRGSVEVRYTVRNPGNVRLAARQSIEITAPGGILLRRVALDDLTMLLPGDSVERIETVDGVPPGFRLISRVTLEPSDEQHDSAPDPITGTSSTWAIPWIQSAIVLTLIGVLLVRRRHRRRRSTQPGAVPTDASNPVETKSQPYGTSSIGATRAMHSTTDHILRSPNVT